MKVFFRLTAPLVAVLVGYTGVGATEQHEAAGYFEVRDLGEHAPSAINDRHQIAFASPAAGSHTATGVNNKGQFVGFRPPGDALVWEAPTEMRNLPDLPPSDSRPAASGSDPQDINDAGVIAGWSFGYGGRGGMWQRAARWRNGRVEALGSDAPGRASAAFAINDLGEAAGWAEFASWGEGRAPQRAALWTAEDNPRVVEIGTLGGPVATSVAYDINNARQVVGTSDTPSDHRHAFVWDRGRLVDLGTLPGDTDSEAFAINESGDIVGTSFQSRCGECRPRATLWRDGRAIDLNTLLPAGSDWHLLAATELDEHGCIVGRGLLNGEPRHFLLLAPRERSMMPN